MEPTEYIEQPGYVEQLEYVSVDLQDKVMRDKYVSDKESDLHRESSTTNLQEGLGAKVMSEIRDYMGDGLAKVTVGAELTSSIEYGNKAGAFCSVTATCDNHMEAVKAVHDILQRWAKSQVELDTHEMVELRDSIMTGKAPAAKVAPPPRMVPAEKPNFRR